MGKNTCQHWGFVNPVHLVNPVYLGFILLTYLLKEIGGIK
jgi:hypothetical protein